MREFFNKKIKNTNITVKVIALVSAGIIAITSGVVVLVNSFKGKKNTTSSTPSTSISDTTMDINDLGVELEIPKEEKKSKYENPTGKVNVDKVVEKNDKIYVDKESADKSNKVGNTSTDTKGGTLKVDKDGKVTEKTEGYEIKDDKGNVVEKGDMGENDIPSNFEENKDLGGTYEKEDDTSNLTYSDANYYDEYGNLVLAKGDLVEKERLEYAKKHYSTKKPTVKESTSSSSSKEQTSSKIEVISTPSYSSKNETSSTPSSSSKEQTSSATTTTSSTTSSEGKVNVDGTYTIYGTTYADKATFEQIAMSDLETLDLYLDEKGVLHIKAEEKAKQLIK